MSRRLLGFGFIAAILAAALVALPSPREPQAVALMEPVRVCGNLLSGPMEPPAGATTVPAGDNSGLGFQFREANRTWWFAPGVHTLGSSEFSQIQPGSNSTFIGAPGAILDGQGINRYAFTQHAVGVKVQHLEIRGFVPPTDEGVVNHDSGNDWVIEHNWMHHNKGAAMMAGARQVVRGNCLVDNGQYAMNAFQAGNGIVDLVFENNEVARNAQDGEPYPGCGCTGGVKFWAVDGATIRNNYVHHNLGTGLWADTNDNDFLFEGNWFEANSAFGLFYEISYNLVVRNNVFRGNAWGIGRTFANRGDGFPIGAIYLSETDGDARIPSRPETSGKIEISNNEFTNNWGGVVGWANADRFCNSPASTTPDCTLVVGEQHTGQCSAPAINTDPLWTDCRWWTSNLDIHHNTFAFDPAQVDGGCPLAYCGKSALFSQYGTVPSWSPYKAWTVADVMVFDRLPDGSPAGDRGNNRWHDNTYCGPWSFTPHDTGRSVDLAGWQGYGQDVGSANSCNPPPTTAPTTVPPTTTPPPAAPSVHLTFETGTEHHAAWYGSRVTVSAKKPLYGAGSLLMESTGAFSGVETTNWPGFPIEAGTHTLDFEYVCGSGMPDFEWELRWSDALGNVLRTDVYLVPCSASHREYQATVTAPEGTAALPWRFRWAAGEDLNVQRRAWIRLDELFATKA